ncbi:MAG TPA: nucleotide exchange factor GrpE [Candidatus Poseidoniaceae archaeon]|nr:MAG: nucleotide exchange factor GrpE [Euryarchaeota archaeon TMED141]DAC11687.1 MAG TPA: nucleotide exchange factor GrpE [Candidatus Poseidoniales archaeon]DAC17476.1 MAG TPA: nucleotide exchange factor GrpE [Candidatus Poseidoniales archaeon]HII17724.1 nucleotide exchange factor GrpE [Candidatus Poseidoniaceae archaeon]HII96824.1 nucleotide exchange factor GrpE [Candidatus Poseidoniaceae archaeon]
MSEDSPEEETVEVTVEEPEVEPEPVDPLTEALQRAETAEKEIAYKEADLQNARKRFAQDRADLVRYGAQHLARRMISVLLDVERGLSTTGDDDGPAAGALRLLHDRLIAELKAAGVVRIEAKGHAFDPSKMEAITTVPASDEHPAGQVIEELEAGFMLHDRVLQASRVVVAA